MNQADERHAVGAAPAYPELPELHPSIAPFARRIWASMAVSTADRGPGALSDETAYAWLEGRCRSEASEKLMTVLEYTFRHGQELVLEADYRLVRCIVWAVPEDEWLPGEYANAPGWGVW